MELQLQKPLPLFLLGFLVTVAYIPGVIGASISTGWFVLLIVAPFCIRSVNLGYGLAFIIFAALSLLWTTNANIGLFFLFQIIALACIFQLGEQLKDPKPIFYGLALGLGFSSLVALLQYFYNYKGVYVIDTQNGAVAGLFINSNIYSELSAVILIALITLKLFWWIPVTLPGLILVPSRSALVALGVCGFIWAFKKDRFLAISGFLIICGIGLIFIDKFNLTSVHQRFDLWVDTIRGLKLFGNGVGSFEIQYPLNTINIDTSISRPKYAHNDLLQLIFEFGIGNLLLIPVIWKALKSDSEFKIILYAVGIISLFTYPFHVPTLAFISLLVAGHVSFNNDTVLIGRNSRGSALFKRIKRKRLSTI